MPVVVATKVAVAAWAKAVIMLPGSGVSVAMMKGRVGVGGGVGGGGPTLKINSGLKPAVEGPVPLSQAKR